MENNIYETIVVIRQQLLELGNTDEKIIIRKMRNILHDEYGMTDDTQIENDIKLTYNVYDIEYPSDFNINITESELIANLMNMFANSDGFNHQHNHHHNDDESHEHDQENDQENEPEHEPEHEPDDDDDDIFERMNTGSIFDQLDQNSNAHSILSTMSGNTMINNIFNNFISMDQHHHGTYHSGSFPMNNGVLHFEIHGDMGGGNMPDFTSMFPMFLNLMGNQNMGDVPVVLTKESLDKLPICIFKNIPKEDREKCITCSICLENYKDDDKIRVLPCKHGFHPDCIDPWLEQYNYKCPLCRNETSGEKKAVTDDD